MNAAFIAESPHKAVPNTDTGPAAIAEILTFEYLDLCLELMDPLCHHLDFSLLYTLSGVSGFNISGSSSV